MTSILPDRFPLKKIKKKWSQIAGAVGGVVTALVSAGIISAAEGQAVTGLFTNVDSLFAVIPGVLAAASAVWSAFKTGSEGEREVTPVEDPKNNLGEQLVPEVQGPPPGYDPATAPTPTPGPTQE